MRVNPNSTILLLNALQRISGDENGILRQMASGKRIQKPSDDPAGIAALVELQGSDANTQQYLRNVSALRSRTQVADSTLNSAVLALERALSLAVRGANGTMSATDRNAVALELEGIYEQMVDIANSSLQGTYLFAGTATMTKPFVSAGSSVSYAGSESTNQVQIGEGLWIRTAVCGTDIFGADGHNAFQSLQDAADAIRSGADVNPSLDALRASRDRISAARVVYGNALNQLDSAELVMNERHLQLAQQETDLAGADMAEVITQLSSAETARNALLSTIAKSGSTNLFDFLSRG